MQSEDELKNPDQTLRSLSINTEKDCKHGAKLDNQCEPADNPNDRCPVCFVGLSTAVVHPCQHVFCEDCIVQWTHQQHFCPLCKTDILMYEISSPTGEKVSKPLSERKARTASIDEDLSCLSHSYFAEEVAKLLRTLERELNRELASRRPQPDVVDVLDGLQARLLSIQSDLSDLCPFVATELLQTLYEIQDSVSAITRQQQHTPQAGVQSRSYAQPTAVRRLYSAEDSCSDDEGPGLSYAAEQMLHLRVRVTGSGTSGGSGGGGRKGKGKSRGQKAALLKTPPKAFGAAVPAAAAAVASPAVIIAGSVEVAAAAAAVSR